MDVAQIQSLCADMDRLWCFIASQGQRGLWKRLGNMRKVYAGFCNIIMLVILHGIAAADGERWTVVAADGERRTTATRWRPTTVVGGGGGGRRSTVDGRRRRWRVAAAADDDNTVAGGGGRRRRWRATADGGGGRRAVADDGGGGRRATVGSGQWAANATDGVSGCGRRRQMTANDADGRSAIMAKAI